MALTTFTVTNAIGAGDLGPFAVSSTTGFPAVGTYASPPQIMQVDGEKMLVQVVPVSGSVKVMQRGYDGTVAVAHQALAFGMTSSDPQDFLNVPTGGVTTRPPYVDDFIEIGVNTTFTATGTAPTATTQPYPIKNTTYVINKASACAIELIAVGATTPAPSAASAGVRMRFTNAVAAANTVTYGPGFNGDTTTSDVATSIAKVGATLDLMIGPTGLISCSNASVNASTAQWTLA